MKKDIFELNKKDLNSTITHSGGITVTSSYLDEFLDISLTNENIGNSLDNTLSNKALSITEFL